MSGDESLPNSEAFLILTEQEKGRIRAEELYREQLRAEISKPKTGIAKLLAFLNSPLGIYVLSSLLLSGATYVYTQHKENQDKQRAQKEELAKVQDEILFREHQLEESSRNAEATTALFLDSTNQFPPNTDPQGEYSYHVECEEVAAAARAGGLISPPGDLPPTFRYRDLTLTSNLLIYRFGYKYPDYKYLNIRDLAIKKQKLEHIGAQPSEQEVLQLNVALTNLDDALGALDDASFILAKNGFIWKPGSGVAGARIGTRREMADAMKPLLENVRNKFEVLRRNPLLAPAP